MSCGSSCREKIAIGGDKTGNSDVSNRSLPCTALIACIHTCMPWQIDGHQHVPIGPDCRVPCSYPSIIWKNGSGLTRRSKPILSSRHVWSITATSLESLLHKLLRKDLLAREPGEDNLKSTDASTSSWTPKVRECCVSCCVSCSTSRARESQVCTDVIPARGTGFPAWTEMAVPLIGSCLEAKSSGTLKRTRSTCQPGSQRQRTTRKSTSKRKIYCWPKTKDCSKAEPRSGVRHQCQHYLARCKLCVHPCVTHSPALRL